MENIAAFSGRDEFAKARDLLTERQLPYEIVSPDPAYSLVGVPALACDSQGLSAILSESKIICAGWTRLRSLDKKLPDQSPCQFEEDVFGAATIMFFGPCMADENRSRLIAHLSGDISLVLPYLNTAMPHASFNKGPCTLTFMDGSRLVTLYPRRIAIGKAEDLVDGWQTLEKIRVMVNEAWARRSTIVPSYEMRSKPPALEIYKRLPRTNCKACGEQTCMAFAVKLWMGRSRPSLCTPVFSEEHAALRGALLEICRGLGVADTAEMPSD